MIVGIGLDIVNISRFVDHLSPALTDRLFSESERGLSAERRAGVFAVKEAVIKALGGVDSFSWHDIHVSHDNLGAPAVTLTGGVLGAAEEHGVSTILVSLSHDAPVAAAMIVLEGTPQ